MSKREVIKIPTVSMPASGLSQSILLQYPVLSVQNEIMTKEKYSFNTIVFLNRSS